MTYEPVYLDGARVFNHSEDCEACWGEGLTGGRTCADCLGTGLRLRDSGSAH